MREKIKFIAIIMFLSTISEIGIAKDTLCFLPKPSGQYSIGTATYYLTDSTRKEKFTCKGKDYRTLKVKIWYPAKDYDGPFDNYLNEYSIDELFSGYQSFSKDRNFFVQLKNYKTHSKNLLPIAKSDKKFPLIIFSQGYYFGLDDFYTSYMENLASNGYIVVSLTHTYEQIITKIADQESVKIKKMRVSRAFIQWQFANLFKTQHPDPENREKVRRILRFYFRRISVLKKSMHIWVDDSKFIIDEMIRISKDKNSLFFDNIDFDNIASAGMSYGGAVAVQHGLLDNRVKTCINLDGFQFGDVLGKTINIPIFMMQSELYYNQMVGNNEIFSDTHPYYYLQFFNSKHYIFSDCAIFPNLTKEKIKYLIGFESGNKHIELTNKYMLSFLNHYLRGKEKDDILKEINNSIYRFKIRE